MAAVVGVSSTSGVGTLTAPVAVTAFTSACFGTTSPDSVNINLFGADFLVVAVGWSSASSAYTAPLVVCNGEAMTLVTSAREWDTSSGAVGIYTLPIFNAANTSVPITLTQTSFIGNVQIAAYAYKNSSQSLGVIVTDEYGTNSSGVNTGTTAINGVLDASVFTFAGFTFFGGTPTAITFPAGWTDSNQATASNEGVYCAYTSQSGNYSVTVTPSPNSFFNMLCMGWEVLAGQPPSTGSGVNLVAYTSVAFGSVTAAAPGSTTFDPTTAANLLVATVGWASSGTLTAAQAAVTFGGNTMTLQSAPQTIDGSNGEVAVWILPLSNSSSGTFTFNCSPNFAGLTSAVLTAYSNASSILGVTVSDEYGSNGVEVPSGTTSISGVANGSSFSYVAMGFFGNAPTYLDCSTGWNPVSNVSATNQSAFAFNYRYQNQSSFSITLQNPTNDFNTLNVGYEVATNLNDSTSVIGVAGTGNTGSLSVASSSSVSITGVTATGAIGTLGLPVSNTVLRQVPVGSFPFTVFVNENQTFQAAVGDALINQAVAVPSLSSSVPITGVAGTGVAAPLSIMSPSSITGVAGAGQAGTGTASNTVPVIGVVGTGAAGALIARVSGSISGVIGTGQAGAVTISASNTTSLSGVAGTGQAGTVTTSAGTLVSISGVTGTGQAGAVTISTSASVSITGVVGTGQAGNVTPNAGTIAPVIGVAGTGNTGSLSAVSSSAVSITGISGTGAAGTLSLPIPDTVLRQAPVLSFPFNIFVNENQTFQAPVGAALVEQAVSAPTSVSIAGTFGTGAAGSPRGESDHPLTGATGTSQVGSLTDNLAVRIGGVFGNGQADVVREAITNQPVMMICL